MKKLSLICLCLLLSACQLAKDSSKDTKLDALESYDPLIGAMVRVFEEDESIPALKDEIEATCTLQEDDYVCDFDLEGYYISLWPAASEDDRFYSIDADDSPLIVLNNDTNYNMLSEDDDSDFDSIISKSASIELNLELKENSEYTIQLVNIFYDKEENRVYAKNFNSPHSFINDEDPITSTVEIEYTQDYVEQNTQYNESVKLVVNTGFASENYTLLEYDKDHKELLRKELDEDMLDEEYAPLKDCSYLVLIENTYDLKGNDLSEYKIYDRKDTALEVSYRYDDKILSRKSVMLKWS